MKKRVAVCFSGQPRTWRQVFPSWSSFLKNDQYHIDVFCHAWDYNTASANLYKSPEPVKLHVGELNELFNMLNPVRVKIESERSFVAASPDQAMSNPAHLSQFYGIISAARLKRSYELENQLVYDVVVRTRYDILFESNITEVMNDLEVNTFHGFGLKFNYENKSCMVSDLCWISDGLTYDRIADLYLDAPTIEKKWFNYEYGPEHVLFHHLKTNQIAVKDHSWDIKIIRESKNGDMDKNQ